MTMSGVRLMAIALASCLLTGRAAALHAAERPWLEVRSPHFVAVSDGSEKSARDALWAFEQMRGAIHKMWPFAGVDADRPIVLLLPRGESGMRELLPRLAEQKLQGTPSSTFATGPDRYYIALRTDVPPDFAKNINPYRQAFSSYISLALRTGVTQDLPPWIRDGLTSVVSNAYMRESSVDLGRPDTFHLQRLRTGGRIPLAEIVATDSLKDWDFPKLQTFFAQTWGLAHYLLLADDGAHRDQLSRFLQLVAEGKTSPVAFELAFGDGAQISDGLERYINRPVLSFMHFAADDSISREAFVVRNLLVSDTAAMRAAFLAATNRPAEARAELASARAHMTPAATFELEGMLFEADRNAAQALAAYTQAIELGSTNFYPYYRKAALTPRREEATRVQAEQLLERAVALAPLYAPALVMLADAKVALGRGADALPIARRAVALDPGRVMTRLALARVLWTLNQREDVVRQVREALALARNEGERDLAQRTLDNYLKPTAR